MPYAAGNGLIIVNGPAEVPFTLEQLRAQWGTLHMRIFLGALLLLLAGLHAGTLYCKKLEAAAHATPRARWRARMKPNSGLTFAHAVLFSAFSAMIGEQTRPPFWKSLPYFEACI